MNTAHANRLLNDRELQSGAETLVSLPRRLIATLTTACNSRCIMCEVKRSAWEIDDRTLAEITGLLPSLESVAWQGGEVFIWDRFPDLFDEAARHATLRQTAVTNGQSLTPAWIEKLVRVNMELAVSVDGTSREVYEKIRSGSRFDVLTRSLEDLSRAREAVASPLSLRMHAVVMRSNMHELSSFIEFAHQYRFDALHLMPLWGTEAPQESIFGPGREKDQARVAALVGDIRRKALEYGIAFMHSLPVREEPAAHSPRCVTPQEQHATPADVSSSAALLCSLPWQQLNIDPGGGVRPGCLCSRSVGSISEQSLAALWNGERMRQYRACIARAGGRGQCNPACLNGDIPSELRKI